MLTRSSHALRGIFPALPTPVRADDTRRRRRRRARCSPGCRPGIDGVVPIGGTGEYGALPRSERVRMAALCVKATAGKVPVIAGVLDPGFHDALAGRPDVRRRRRRRADGADALLHRRRRRPACATTSCATPTRRRCRS